MVTVLQEDTVDHVHPVLDPRNRTRLPRSVSVLTGPSWLTHFSSTGRSVDHLPVNPQTAFTSIHERMDRYGVSLYHRTLPLRVLRSRSKLFGFTGVRDTIRNTLPNFVSETGITPFNRTTYIFSPPLKSLDLLR